MKAFYVLCIAFLVGAAVPRAHAELDTLTAEVERYLAKQSGTWTPPSDGPVPPPPAPEMTAEPKTPTPVTEDAEGDDALKLLQLLTQQEERIKAEMVADDAAIAKAEKEFESREVARAAASKTDARLVAALEGVVASGKEADAALYRSHHTFQEVLEVAVNAHGHIYGKQFSDLDRLLSIVASKPNPDNWCLNNCSYNGVCVDSKCICNPGWKGADCSLAPDSAAPEIIFDCPLNCSNAGICVDGRCICNPGYNGPGCEFKGPSPSPCELPRCPNNCSGHGICRMGKCYCVDGYEGFDCSVSVIPCPNNCNNRGKCVEGRCICDNGFCGGDCAELTKTKKKVDNNKGCNPPCEHGKCVDGRCQCSPGFVGPTCSQVVECPNNCSRQGRCVLGVCQCDYLWGGVDCSKRLCINNCTNILQGVCVEGTCNCRRGFTDVDCSKHIELPCPNNCMGHGICDEGVCQCVKGYTGLDCSIPVCPNNCSGHGDCFKGKCYCFKNWTEIDCSRAVCPDNCNYHGDCSKEGKCMCYSQWLGHTCNIRKCPNGCSGHGVCNNGTCLCDEDWTGHDCSSKILHCPNCQNGDCVNGTCVCHEGWSGPNCNVKLCQNNCSGRGTCDNGTCLCDAGHAGPDCEILSEIYCKHNCSGHGICNEDATCECIEHFAGDDCSIHVCPMQCHHRGQCFHGKCHCNKPWTGVDCNILLCPQKCLHGTCQNGTCACADGWTGKTCNIQLCPNNCNGHGSCVNGTCHCSPGRGGADCGAPVYKCPGDCNPPNGVCNNGTCVCSPGYSGVDCSFKNCPNDCSGHGVCLGNGTCQCYRGFTGPDCATCVEIKCPNNCNGHGLCNDGVCQCLNGWAGEDCSVQPACKNNCSNHGQCFQGRCVCFPGWIGENCCTATCKGNCNGHGTCQNGTCFCNTGFAGVDCSVVTEACRNNCSGRGVCAGSPPSCECQEGYTGSYCQKRAKGVVKVIPGAIDGHMWSAKPTLEQVTIQQDGEWTDIPEMSIKFNLNKPSNMFGTYSMTVQPDGAPLEDWIGTRLVIDGKPLKDSGSHYQPLTKQQAHVVLTGNTVFQNLTAGEHTLSLQWYKFGTAVPSWSSTGHSQFIGGRSLVLLAHPAPIWSADATAGSITLEESNKWVDVPGLTTTVTLKEKETLFASFSLGVKPASHLGGEDLLGVRIVVNDEPQHESGAMSNSDANVNLRGNAVYTGGPGTYTVKVQWYKQGDTVTKWKSGGYNQFVGGRTLVVLGEPLGVWASAPLDDFSFMRNEGWKGINSTGTKFSIGMSKDVFFTYNFNAKRDYASGTKPDDRFSVRINVDGTPYAESASHFQPDLNSMNNQAMYGNMVAHLPKGPHSAFIEWSIRGKQDAAWTSCCNDRFMGGKALFAMAYGNHPTQVITTESPRVAQN